MFSYFLVRGHSMEPSAREGDFVFAWKLFFRPKEGDMVVFLNSVSGVRFLKRITKCEGNRYWMEGDNARDTMQVGWVEKKYILGKAYVIRR